MVPSFTNRSALRLALVATAALSMAACATKKPLYPTATAGPQTQQTPQGPPDRTVTQQTTPMNQGPAAGTERDFVVNVGDRVYFDFDSYTVRSDATALLDAQAAWLKRYPAVQVRIEGNCDEKGTREYNIALGARRANAVRDYFASHGVEAGRVTTVSYGKEKPVDMGSGDEADQHNRNGHTAIVGGARMN